MNAIKALIERMSQAPHEFVEEGETSHTRWAHVTSSIYQESKTKPRVFTQEEIDTYLDGVSKIIRAQMEEAICIEILNPLRPDTNTQMELFPNQSAYPPGTKMRLQSGGGTGRPLTANQITSEALKILEQELYKNNKPQKLIL